MRRVGRFVVMCVCLYGGNEWMQAKPIITYYYIITGGINLIFCIAFGGIAHSISIPLQRGSYVNENVMPIIIHCITQFGWLRANKRVKTVGERAAMGWMVVKNMFKHFR